MNDQQKLVSEYDQALPTMTSATTPPDSTCSSDMATYTISEIIRKAQNCTKQITDKFINTDSGNDTRQLQEANSAINDLAAFRRLLSKLDLQTINNDENKSVLMGNQIDVFIRSIRSIDLDKKSKVFVHEKMYITDDYEQRLIFVRPCYCDFIELIFSNKYNYSRICITGNPGVGKTLFGMYIIVNALKRYNLNVLYYPQYGKPIFFPIKGAAQADVDVQNYLSSDNNLLYLIDNHRSNITTSSKCKTVLLCSSIHLYSSDNFHNGSHPVLFYMPMWTLDELEECRTIIYGHLSALKIQKDFAQLGGFPRIAFRDDSACDYRHVDMVIEQCDISILDYDSTKVNIKDKSGQIIVRKENESDAKLLENKYLYNNTSQEFASVGIGERITTKLLYTSRTIIANFLQAAAGNSQLAVMRGNIFEQFAHQVLPLGGRFKCRRLFNKTHQMSTRNTTANDNSTQYRELEPRQIAEPYKNLTDIKKGFYNRPSAKNAPTFDAIITGSTPVMLFQMTINKIHSLKFRGLISIQTMLEKENTTDVDVYFVVPPDVFESYQHEQKIERKNKKEKDVSETEHEKLTLKIHQFVLEIPYCDQ